jgi:hypothetical protein
MRVEIAQLEEDMEVANSENDRDFANTQKERAQFAEIVDWKEERQDLREELEKLHDEIQKRKSEVSVGEQRNNAKQTSLAKYGPLVIKWRGKTTEDDIPDKSIAELYAEMEDAKRRSEEITKNSEREMSEILMKNAKLEEEVNRRKTGLERTISHFYAEEHQSRKRIEDRRQKAEEDEKKLIAQIQKTKLKLAQKHLRKQ